MISSSSQERCSSTSRIAAIAATGLLIEAAIFRTTMEEIVVRTDTDKKTLEFTIHWKGCTSGATVT
jgi:hypothetical protein